MLFRPLRTIYVQSFILLLCMLVGGSISLKLGKDIDFDLANYHYYNAYAFLHQLTTENYWPPSYLHVFLNPLADVISFSLINFFSAKFAVFISGALHGINLYLLFLIAGLFVEKNNYPKWVAFIIAVCGICGPLALPSMGNFKNDHLIAIFILSFVYLQILFWQRFQNKSNLSLKYLAYSAILLGFGVGLKLTSLVYLIGACCATVLLPIDLRTKTFIVIFSGVWVIFGFMLSSGYWVFHLWQVYHNPVFPFYNGIFHSPDFPFYNINFPEHLPGSLLKTVFFPFYFSFSGTPTDGKFRDFRILFVYLLTFALLLKWIWSCLLKNKRIIFTNKDSLSYLWILLFFVSTYLTEMFLIGGIRYILAIEILAPCIIYILVKILLNVPEHFKITLTIFFTIFITTTYASVGTRSPIVSTDYFNVKFSHPLPSVNDALVLTPFSVFAHSTDPRPQIYLIPFLPKSWRFVGLPFHNGNYVVPEKTVLQKIQTRIYQANTLFVLAIASSLQNVYQAVETFGLKPDGSCIKIYSERQQVNQEDVLLCPLKVQLSMHKVGEPNNSMSSFHRSNHL